MSRSIIKWWTCCKRSSITAPAPASAAGFLRSRRRQDRHVARRLVRRFHRCHAACVVWVGFDDNRELNLEGARSALPIWTAFMRKAAERSRYAPHELAPRPNGLAAVEIDTETGKLAGASCELKAWAYFIQGQEPTEECDGHQHNPLAVDRSAEFCPARRPVLMQPRASVILIPAQLILARLSAQTPNTDKPSPVPSRVRKQERPRAPWMEQPRSLRKWRPHGQQQRPRPR